MSKFTKEQLAALLNGREYGDEMTNEHEWMAKESGLVVVFGYSDDNVELRGAIVDEICCDGGGEFMVCKTGVVVAPCPNERVVLKRFGVLEQIQNSGHKISAVWGKGGYSWTCETDIPHATFEIHDGGEKYCRGIVFSIDDLN